MLRLNRLYRDHAKLEEQIRREMRAKSPDFKRLTILKKIKLHIKDRIAALSRTRPPLTA